MQQNKRKPESLTIDEVVVADQFADQRCDRWLQNYARLAGKSLIYKWIRTGQFRVDGKRCRPSSRLQCGQRIRIPRPAIYYQGEAKSDVAGAAIRKHARMLGEMIVAVTNDLIVINKPEGLSVQGGERIKLHLVDLLGSWNSLEVALEVAPKVTSVCQQKALQENDLPSRGEATEAITLDPASSSQPVLIHRLDKATSGVMLLGRNRLVARQIMPYFQSGLIEKAYLALVAGEVAWQNNFAADNLVTENGFTRSVAANGKAAYSEFVCMARGDNVSLLMIFPATGRKHQIRVHLAKAGFPILGDSRYGNRNTAKALPDNSITRMMLHSLAVQISGNKINQLASPAITLPLQLVLPDKQFVEICQHYRIMLPAKSALLQQIISHWSKKREKPLRHVNPDRYLN